MLIGARPTGNDSWLFIGGVLPNIQATPSGGPMIPSSSGMVGLFIKQAQRSG